MEKDYKSALLLVFSLAGLVFAGYLSSKKLFTNTCAFNESCPYFLGYPACYYGFVMYLALAILGIFLVAGGVGKRKGAGWMMFVSFLGILFAGSFTLGELPILFKNGLSAYVLGLPTCALGLIFYIIIFCISIALYRKNKAAANGAMM